ncbi:hypothetical protein Clacol_005060 [Clathrus columnatus]|uniref:Uncharacterized protein n=1 Tax=Clathrus columnatus TaxID=1419009 RepID=A0AAV5A881_9AGAM|nr:hypothetical protein Clacol_005060 [Clathrus columnatus]
MTVAWTLGAFELGVLFASVLYGIVLSQTFTYTQEKFRDPIWLKVLVSMLFRLHLYGQILHSFPKIEIDDLKKSSFLDTLHTVGLWSLLYEWSSHDFGNAPGLEEITWMFILTFSVSPVENVVVQKASFQHRKLSKGYGSATAIYRW